MQTSGCDVKMKSLACVFKFYATVLEKNSKLVAICPPVSNSLNIPTLVFQEPFMYEQRFNIFSCLML